jgi:glycosyltransferase involved in cell wall biosynthesis
MGAKVPRRKITYLYADGKEEWNCSQWRALTPSDSINAEREAGRTQLEARLFYMPSAIDWNSVAVHKALGDADVLVWQRNIIIPEIWAAMDYWRALGKVVAVDLDDHYPELPASNPAFAYWVQNRGGMPESPVKLLEEGMRHADYLLSPSKVILQDWSHVVRGKWMPNWTRRAWYEKIDQKPIGTYDVLIQTTVKDGAPVAMAHKREGSEGQIVIGWGGSISHVDSWLYSGVIEALDGIFAEHPNVVLKFCGGEDRLDKILGRWGDRVVRQPGVRPEDWPIVVSAFDIGIAPLDVRPLDPPWREGAPVASYDERRSWLKGVEYLSAGVPWVASRSETYNDLAKWGTLVENTPDAWYTALDHKIRNLKQAKATAWNNRRWALRHVTFESNVTRYANEIERMIAERTAGGKARLPGVIRVGMD